MVDMRTVDIGFSYGDKDAVARRLHPDGDCYLEERLRLKNRKGWLDLEYADGVWEITL